MKILLAIDDSQASRSAVDEVCRRPWPAETEVRLLSVPSRIEMMILRENASPSMTDKIGKLSDSHSLGFVKDAATILENRAPNLRVMPMLLGGRNANEVILREAERWNADLIVVGSHGYGPIRRFLFGSVSAAVALNAKCSVEIVRNNLEKLSA